jgi:WD40 repeat protein
MTSKWEALVVGINEYPFGDRCGLPPLTAAVNDADQIVTKLKKYGYRSFHIQRLPDQPNQKGGSQVSPDGLVKATELQNSLENLLMPPVKEPPETALFFFSGHGWHQEVDGKKELFLATSDVFVSEEQEDNVYGVAISWLGELIKRSQVRRVIIWLDCCYSGELINYLDLHDNKDLPDRKDYCIFTATRSYEQGIELKNYEKSQSLFTESLLKGLNPEKHLDSNGIVDSHKLAKYIEENMPKEGQQPRFANSKHSISLIHKGGPDDPIDKCPYLALNYFSEQEADFFYGRTELTNTLVEHIKNKDRFITIFGASGSGKSSLIRAGLLYQLKLGKAISGSNDWIYLDPFPPTNDPLARLTEVIEKSKELSPIFREFKKEQNLNLKDQENKISSQKLAKFLATFFETVKKAPTPIVLIIDQFEECFTMSDQETTKNFINLLTKLIKELPNLYLIIGMRNDFRGRLREFPDFSDAIKAKVNMEHLNREEIEEAIMKPAQAVRLEVDKDLKEKLIKDVEDYPGSLPLLQYTLTELWSESHKKNSFRLQLSSYTALNGIEGTLNKRAKEVYDSLSSEEQKLARRIFLELTQIGDRSDIRRRIRLEDLVNSHHTLEDLDRVTAILANPKNRLITRSDLEKSEDTDKPQTSSPQPSSETEKDAKAKIMIDVVHKALIRHWDELRKWKEQYTNDAMVIERSIETAAKEWDQRGRKNEDLLPKFRLAEAEGYLKDFDKEWQMLDGMAEKFIEESRKHKQRTRFYWISGGIAIGAILVIASAISVSFGLDSQQKTLQANTSKEEAQKAKNNAESQSKKAQESADAAKKNQQEAEKQAEKAEREKKRANKNQAKAQEKTKEAENNLNLAQKKAREAKVNEEKAKISVAEAKQKELEAKKNANEAKRQTIIANNSLQVNIFSLTNNSQELFESNKKFEALLTSLNAVKSLNSLKKSLKQLGSAINTDTEWAVKDALRNAVFWVKEQNRLEGHKGAVNKISFSPDGRFLASDSTDSTIKIWDVSTGKVINTLDKNKLKTNSFSFIKDGLLAYDSADGTVKVWNVTTGKVIKTFNKNAPKAKSVTLSPNGWVASPVTDNSLKIWDITTGKTINTLQADRIGVNKVIFSPDGQRLASQSEQRDQIIWKIWNVTTSKPISTCQRQAGGFVDSVSFSPNGQLLASAGEDRLIHLCNVATGQEIKALEGHTWRIGSVSFSPNGKMLVAGDWNKIIKLWDVATGQEIKTFTGHKGKLLSVSFSLKGNLFASASDDGAIKLWNLSEGKEIIALKDDDYPVGEGLSFSPNKKLLASTTRTIYQNQKNTIKLWDVTTHKKIATLTGHGHWIYGVGFSPDGKWLASAAWDDTIGLWDVRACIKATTCKASEILGGHANFHSVSFSPDGKLLASAGNDYFPTDGVKASNGPNNIQIWDVATRPIKSKPIEELPGHTGFIYQVSFSPDGKRLASGSEDKTIKIWDVTTRKNIKTLTGHSDGVNGVSFSPDGKLLASASSDHTIKIWDVATGKNIKTLTGHSSAVKAVIFSPDGKWLVSGSEDQTIKRWDLATGKAINTFSGHRNIITNLSLSNDGQLIASAARQVIPEHKGELILWDLKTLSNLTLDELITRGCNWVRGYLENNPNVTASDRHLCDGKPKKPNAKNG